MRELSPGEKCDRCGFVEPAAGSPEMRLRYYGRAAHGKSECIAFLKERIEKLEASVAALGIE